MNQFVACLNKVRHDLNETALEDFANSVIGLCLKHSGDASTLGAEVLRLTLTLADDDS